MAPPKGSLLFANRGSGPLQFLSVNGAVLTPPSNNIQLFPSGICVGIESSDVGYIFAGSTNGGLYVYNADLALTGVATRSPSNGYFNPSINASGNVCAISAYPSNSFVDEISITGQRLQSWSFVPTVGAVNKEKTRAYHPDPLGVNSFTIPVFYRDLGASSSTLAITRSPTGSFFYQTGVFGQIKVIPSTGEILIGWWVRSFTSPTLDTWEVVRYAPGSFSPLATYSVPGFPYWIVLGLDATTIWVSYRNGTGATSSISEIRLSDGAVLHNFSLSSAGISLADPFCILRVGAAVPSTPPSIPLIPKTPTTIVASPARSAGCNLGGIGWRPSYTGPSGVVPVGANPTDGELLTGKRVVRVWARVEHDDSYV